MSLKTTTVILESQDTEELKRKGYNVSKVCRDAISQFLGSSDSVDMIDINIQRHQHERDNYAREKDEVIRKLTEDKHKILQDQAFKTRVHDKIADLMRAQINLGRSPTVIPDIDLIKRAADDIDIPWQHLDRVFQDRDILDMIIGKHKIKM